MEAISNIIQAIAALLWPILVFVVLLIFRRELRYLATRLKSGKFLGQEIELSEALNHLEQSVSEARSEVITLPQDAPAERNTSEVNKSGVVYAVMDLASRSPKAALMLLASEIERELRELLARIALVESSYITNSPISVRRAFQILEERGIISRQVANSVELFWKARNHLIHGHASEPDDIMRALDSGIVILKTLQSTPTETYRIVQSGIDLYEDPEGKKKREGIKGVVLETVSAGGVQKWRHMYPSTNADYKAGDVVSYEWNPHVLVQDSWYKDPNNGRIEVAWVASEAMFVGRPLVRG